MKYLTSLMLMSAVSLMACGNAPSTPNETQAPIANDVIHEGVMVANPILLPPLPGRTTAMATMVLMNHTDNDDHLIDVRAELDGDLEIHTMINDDGIMKMRRLENGIALPAGGSHVLKRGGDHLMIFNTAVPSDLKSVGFTLIFEKAGEVYVKARVDDGSLERADSAHDHSNH